MLAARNTMERVTGLAHDPWHIRQITLQRALSTRTEKEIPMHELIKLSIEAHGGLDRWHRVRRIAATFKPDGIAFKQRNQEAFTQAPMKVIVDTHQQKTIFDPFLGTGKIGLFERGRAAVESAYGVVLDELKNPRESFKALAPGMPWQSTQLLYFVGYAMWMYLTVPFSLLHDGVTFKEVEPWSEDGETWRALRVTFPPSYITHCSEQTLYFDDDGLIRRHDYAVDINGGKHVAHYLYDHRIFDGIVFPTKRRVYLRGEDGTPQKGLAVIAVDLDDFQLALAAD